MPKLTFGSLHLPQGQPSRVPISLQEAHTWPNGELVERYRELDESYNAFCRRTGGTVDLNALQVVSYADG